MPGVRKVILFTIGTLGALVAILALVGLTLPVGHRATRTTTYAVPPDRVFALIADVQQYASWRPDVTAIEMLPPEGGLVRFREDGANGPIVFRVETSEPPRRLVVRIADPSQPFGGVWTHELKATANGGTEHTITEDGEVYNPIFRTLSRFVFSPTATIEAFQAALSRRAR
jgi:uncharacterized protein YndB with AHSA1/START domain